MSKKLNVSNVLMMSIYWLCFFPTIYKLHYFTEEGSPGPAADTGSVHSSNDSSSSYDIQKVG